MRKTRVKTTDRELAAKLGLDVADLSDAEVDAKLTEHTGIGADLDGIATDAEWASSAGDLSSDTAAALEQATSDDEEQAGNSSDPQTDNGQSDEAKSAEGQYDFAEELDRAEHRKIAASPFRSANWTIIKPREWLYAGHYIRGYVTGTSAPSKQGKSTLVLVEAISMVTGFDLLGVGADKMPPHPLKVWVWNGEDPEEEIVRRIKAICLYYGRAESAEEDEPAHQRFDFTFGDLDGCLFLDSGRDMPIKIATLDRNGHSIKVAEPVVDAMIETIIDNGIDATIIDPFINAHAVPENDTGIDAVVGAFKDVAHRSNSSIEHVQHTRKPRRHGDEVTSDDSRGSTAIIAAWRDSRVVNVMTENDAKTYGVSNRYRYLKVESDRPNMTARGENQAWRHLEGVSLNNAMDGRPADSVGVAVPWSPPEKDDFEKAAEAEAILDAVLELIDQGKRITKQAGGNYAVRDLVGYMSRQKAVTTTTDAIKAVLLSACEGKDAKLEYHAGNRGDAGYRRVKTKKA